jgi:sarcosine oxidase subunit alpha
MTISLRIEPVDGQVVDGQVIDRDRPITFVYNGKRVTGFAGDTIGSALAAGGVKTISRSFKYHRPRGLLCVAGRCPNCMVTVDGAPNVRACITLVADRMVVGSQNAWPSVDFDAMSVLDRADRLMPVGFYYKTFHKPKPMWDLVRPILRAVGGLGKVNPNASELPGYTHRSVHIDVLVIGAGHAGMSAAVAAAESGGQVVLVDEQPTLGAGQAPDETGDLVAAVKGQPSVEVWSDSTAFGFYADNFIAVVRGQEVLTVRAARVVLATGAHEVPFVFPGNDLPGVMLATGAMRLLRMYGVRPGGKVVIATENDSGYAFAAELQVAGVDVAAVLDARTGGAASDLGDTGTRLESGAVVVGATGKGSVRRITFNTSNGRTESIDCDLLLMAGRLQPAAQLALQAGCGTVSDPALRSLVPTDPPKDVYLVGGLVGAPNSGDSAAQGRQVGAAAARGERQAQASWPALGDGSEVADHESSAKKQFICMCEDVSASDLKKAVTEGFADIQILKRYSTATMGPCQGKMCLRNFATTTSKLADVPQETMGLTTMRPPSITVSLGALAGPGHLPVKRTALNHKHIELGAQIVDAGGWQRPYSYGDAASEARAVRERVGLIDVSTLGKLDVRGPDAPRLLDFLYTNRMSNLRVGRIRYGVMCLDNGTILDDGTVTRLSDDRFFVTTTTGNIELIEQWYKWWIATEGDMTAHIADVTSGFAAINVAGPRARAALSRLTDADLSPDGFLYMRSVQAEVAGVPAILLRIGFVGETGWEVHFPSQYADHMWDAITAAGRDFGIAPFGLEAQRILRLEKGHIIVNQDTDSITTPIESGMGWAVRLAKKDFVGRGGLRSVVRRGPRQRLVGFVMDAASPVPRDGSPIVHDGTPVGRVTSTRLSPSAGMPFGLAIVPTALAENGVRVHIPVAGELWAATVQLEPVYDPAGERLRG